MRLLLLVALAAPTYAAEPAATDPVLALLSVIHELPAKSAFDAAAPNARDQVLALARDARVTGPHRARALQALRYWPDDAALDAHRVALTDDRLRHKALRLLGATFGDRSLPLIAPYLRHADPQLRATAIEAAADVKGSAATALLDALAATESVAWVKTRLAAARTRQGLVVR